jgi:hypothetical protein
VGFDRKIGAAAHDLAGLSCKYQGILRKNEK